MTNRLHITCNQMAHSEELNQRNARTFVLCSGCQRACRQLYDSNNVVMACLGTGSSLGEDPGAVQVCDKVVNMGDGQGTGQGSFLMYSWVWEQSQCGC